MRKSAFILVAILGLIVAAPASADTGMDGWWQLNENGGTLANDASGHANNGTMSGAAQWTTGVFGTALAFDGSTGRVTVPDSSSLEPASAVSVTAWVKAAGSPGQWKYIVSKGAAGCSAGSYGLYTGAGGGLMFYIATNAGASFTASPDATAAVWDGGWHYVAGTYDGSTVRLFVDGSEVGSGTPLSGSIPYGLPDTNNLFVGDYAGCSGLDFTGSIDEPQVWGHALSAPDVLVDMHRFTGFFQPVDNLPTVNTVKAGSAIPVKFSLGGNLGLGILSPGSPSSHQVPCAPGATTDAVEETVTATTSGLQYDATADQYNYVWKTDKTWVGTCRQLDVSVGGAPPHSAVFQFTK